MVWGVVEKMGQAQEPRNMDMNIGLLLSIAGPAKGRRVPEKQLCIKDVACAVSNTDQLLDSPSEGKFYSPFRCPKSCI